MLVMFFVFHILVLTIPFCKVSSAPQRANSPDIASFSKDNVQIPSFKDGPLHNASPKPMFHILRNVTKSGGNNNLKSNIFDKMLSEEMLLIKQRFFDRDLIQSSTVSKVKHKSAPTPTIEVHQKWSVVDLFTIPDIIDEVITESTKNENDALMNNENSVESDAVFDDIKINNISENKILELRSLPSLKHAETNLNHAHVSSCASNHIHATPKCSCTRLDHQRCTQTVGGSGVSYSVYPLYLQPYQTFFLSDDIQNPYENVYYHPKVVNELKLPKKTKRRKTTPLPPDVYYDDNKSKETDDDEYSSRPKQKHPNIIMNIDYDLVDANPKKTNCNKHEGTNKLNLINDLNEVYFDGVNKKCYCSQSTHNFPKQRHALYIFLIAHTYKYFHYKILFF